MPKFLISKKIEIDAGHRLPQQGNKCSNFHGHRYVIEAVCSGDARSDKSSSEGMAGGLDFSFLKKAMVEYIDYSCDHGLILCVDDPYLDLFVENKGALEEMKTAALFSKGVLISDWFYGPKIKLYLTADPPTAENLAKLWYNKLQSVIARLSNGRAVLEYIKVNETPTCFAIYPYEGLAISA